MPQVIQFSKYFLAGGENLKRRQAIAAWLFLTPFLLTALFFLVGPLGYALYLSTQTDTLVGGVEFVGIENYITTLGDPVFLEGVKRVFVFGLIQIPIMLGIATIGALMLDIFNSRLARTFRLIAFMPYAVPGVVAALMWGFLYSKSFGPFVGLFEALGFDNFNFFVPHTFIYSMSNVITWAWTGYNMIIIYSALQGLPREMYESAIVDGANQIQVALRVKIPAVKSAILLTAIFAIIGTMQIFTEPKVLQRYTNAVSNGYTPNIYSFNLAFVQSQFNYSAAVSFTLAIIVFIITALVLVFSRRRVSRGS
jgi:multiple sugar transport system permease protein